MCVLFYETNSVQQLNACDKAPPEQCSCYVSFWLFWVSLESRTIRLDVCRFFRATVCFIVFILKSHRQSFARVIIFVEKPVVDVLLTCWKAAFWGCFFYKQSRRCYLSFTALCAALWWEVLFVFLLCTAASPVRLRRAKLYFWSHGRWIVVKAQVRKKAK